MRLPISLECLIYILSCLLLIFSLQPFCTGILKAEPEACKWPSWALAVYLLEGADLTRMHTHAQPHLFLQEVCPLPIQSSAIYIPKHGGVCVFISFMCMSLCLHVPGTFRVQKCVSDPLKLEVGVVVS